MAEKVSQKSSQLKIVIFNCSYFVYYISLPAALISAPEAKYYSNHHDSGLRRLVVERQLSSMSSKAAGL
ncbi:hypothetical protein M441DRAFT_360876 [Trichoderma asperellum CBS 433.97]|uniref:Uncharacterized protein n=1 Tax=Trichoderma asperellum (strain ATCC 204424 / CBS 433.97 / NBRC 101777) TaxID=1042311 RepID=A0A2T3ZDL8_TRIA4|nr:hypothetical protein M441DRAFT_360876 [Trichoderma asperellum CBS 433.97]PTB42884.1 hypothetical protein M441DRAFT_360876 [Trichoderma asperellum CBS 433.97]